MPPKDVAPRMDQLMLAMEARSVEFGWIPHKSNFTDLAVMVM